jgi:hypothetical protein
MLHRHTIVTKTLPGNLKNALSLVVKIVNYGRGQVINHHFFRAFCAEMDSLHAVFFFHTEVKLLS